MDRHDLDRMFDGLKPGPGREQALLRQLLQDDGRRKRPMKNWKRTVVGGLAAALLVTAAAAAAPGLSAPLWRVLGITPEDTQSMELLASGAMPVDITTQSNGATLHITQVLRNRVNIVVVGEFATAEGTVLDTGDFGVTCWKPDTFKAQLPVFLDAEGEPVESDFDGGQSCTWWSMVDEDPLDNRCAVYFQYTGYSEDMTDDIAAMRIEAKDFAYYVGGEHENYTVIPGDWSFEVPLPQHDPGYFCEMDELITNLDGADISLRKVYLSPMGIELSYFREGGPLYHGKAEDDVVERWHGFTVYLKATLTAKDGQSVTLDWGGGGGGISDGMSVTRLAAIDFNALVKRGEYFDPAGFQGGTLTLEWRTETGGTDSASFSLDDLQPMEP